MGEDTKQDLQPTNMEDTGRNPDGTFKKGFSGNPNGRPKNTLKDYIREKFMEMSDEEKEEFLKKISPEFKWRMGEGNPESATDITSGGKVISSELSEASLKLVREYEKKLKDLKTE